MILLVEDFILSCWNKDDLQEDCYFIQLNNGDHIGYSYQGEAFSLNNYWNEISYERVVELVGRFGVKGDLL